MGQKVPSASLPVTQNWEEWFNVPEGHTAIHKGLNGVEKLSDRNLLKFNKGRYKVLHLGRNNLMHEYMVGPCNSKAS